MICPYCRAQQPQENQPYCVVCNYPLQSRPQGFFTKSSQTGYSRADAYSAARQNTMPSFRPQQGSIQMMRDPNGNMIYVQIIYDQNGNPFYVQMVPQIAGRDAYGNPVYTMVPANQVQIQPNMSHDSQPIEQSVPRQPVQSQPAPPIQQTKPQNSPFMEGENPQFSAPENEAPPPVPVMPRPGEQPPESSVPDRPAMRASAIASSMYAAGQAVHNTGSFFSRVQQHAVPVPDRNHSVYEMPVSAEELLREADTAFLPSDMPDENAVLEHIFQTRPKEYRMSNAGAKNATFSVSVSSDEIASVSERSLYQTSQKQYAAPESSRSVRAEEPRKEEPKKNKTKKSKEQPKKTIIVDADEFFGDNKRKQPEMLGIRIDGTDDDVNKKLEELRYGGKKSVRSMKSAEQEVDLQALLDDPSSGDAARRVKEEQAYENLESAEIEKVLAQLNQGIFPKK